MSWIVTFSCQLHYVGITGITVPWLGHTVPRVHEDNVSINTHHSKGYPELSLNGFKQPSLRTWGVWRSHTDLVSDCTWHTLAVVTVHYLYHGQVSQTEHGNATLNQEPLTPCCHSLASHWLQNNNGSFCPLVLTLCAFHLLLALWFVLWC